MLVCVLASSSAGNSVFIGEGETRILVDTGNLPVLSYLRPALAEMGEDWQRLDAILITHSHADHLNRNTFSLSWRTRTPVYAPEEVVRELAERVIWSSWPHLGRCLAAGLVRPLGRSWRAGDLEVRPFPLPHDVEPTLGFVVEGARGRVGLATDLGHCPAEVVERLRNCDLLVFEANHDVQMERLSGRPRALVERILGDRGHLSNEQSARALCEIIGTSRRRPRCVLLAHISRQCNHPDLATTVVREALEGVGLGGVVVLPTYHRQPSVRVRLDRRS